MPSLREIDNIVLNGGIVTDPDGNKIGSVEQVFLSGDSGFRPLSLCGPACSACPHPSSRSPGQAWTNP
jgi:hypothetical protein